jgi:hypothetical protein
MVSSSITDDDVDEDFLTLIFGFNVDGISAEGFMELNAVLESYMKDATFKGKEHFKPPSFIGTVMSYDYMDCQKRAYDLTNEDDKKEYKESLAEVTKVRAWVHEGLMKNMRL